MKKLLRLVIAALVLIGLLATALFLNLGKASRGVVEKGSEYALGVESSIGALKASIGPAASSIGFSDLSIGNPAGIQGQPFLDIERFQVDIRTLSVLSDTVKVPEISLDGLHLRLIQDGERSNFREILAHVQALQGAEGTPDSPDPESATETEAGSPGPALLLGAVHVRGVQATVDLRGVPGLEPLTKTFSLPDFDLDVRRAFGGENDATSKASVAELCSELVRKVVDLGIAKAGEELPPEVMAILQGDLSLNSLRDAAETRLEEEVDGLLEDATKKLDAELGKQLKDVFGG